MDYNTFIVAIFATLGVQMATTVSSSYKSTPYYDLQAAVFVNASDVELSADVPTPVASSDYPMPDPVTGGAQITMNGRVLPVSDEAVKLILKDAEAKLKQIADAKRPFYQRWASNVKWAAHVLWQGYSHPTAAGVHTVPPYVIFLVFVVASAQLYRHYCVQVCSDAYVVYRACGICKRYDATATNARWRRLVLATASNQGRFVYNQLSVLCLVASYFMCTFKPHPSESVNNAVWIWNYFVGAAQTAVNYTFVSNSVVGTVGSVVGLQILKELIKHLFDCDCGCCCRNNTESEYATRVQDTAPEQPKPQASMPPPPPPPPPPSTNPNFVDGVDHSREGESHDSDHDDEKEGEGEYADAVDHDAYSSGLPRDNSIESLVKFTPIGGFFSNPVNKHLLRAKSQELTNSDSRNARADDRIKREYAPLVRHLSSFK